MELADRREPDDKNKVSNAHRVSSVNSRAKSSISETRAPQRS
jgi:hypothetical protein